MSDRYDRIDPSVPLPLDQDNCEAWLYITSQSFPTRLSFSPSCDSWLANIPFWADSPYRDHPPTLHVPRAPNTCILTPWSGTVSAENTAKRLHLYWALISLMEVSQICKQHLHYRKSCFDFFFYDLVDDFSTWSIKQSIHICGCLKPGIKVPQTLG